jgi:hypothetical protein
MYDLRTRGRSNQLHLVPALELGASGLQVLQSTGRRAVSWSALPPWADERSVILQFLASSAVPNDAIIEQPYFAMTTAPGSIPRRRIMTA